MPANILSEVITSHKDKMLGGTKLVKCGMKQIDSEFTIEGSLFD